MTQQIRFSPGTGNPNSIESLKTGDKVIRVMGLGSHYSFIELTVNRSLRTKCETNTGIKRRDSENEISVWDKFGKLKCTYASSLDPYIIPHNENNVQWMNEMIAHEEKRVQVREAKTNVENMLKGIHRESSKWLEIEKFLNQK